MFWAFLTPALVGSGVILVGLAVLAFLGALSAFDLMETTYAEGDTVTSVRNSKGHRAYRRKQAALKRRTARDGLVCAWCGLPIDMSLPWHDRMAFTADHPNAIANGGDLVKQDLVPMHRACNSRKSNSQDVEIWRAS